MSMTIAHGSDKTPAELVADGQTRMALHLSGRLPEPTDAEVARRKQRLADGMARLFPDTASGGDADHS